MIAMKITRANRKWPCCFYDSRRYSTIFIQLAKSTWTKRKPFMLIVCFKLLIDFHWVLVLLVWLIIFMIEKKQSAFYGRTSRNNLIYTNTLIYDIHLYTVCRSYDIVHIYIIIINKYIWTNNKNIYPFITRIQSKVQVISHSSCS